MPPRDPERQREYRQRYYQEHREEMLANMRAYYKANRDRMNRLGREWDRRNPEKAREHNRRSALRRKLKDCGYTLEDA